MENNMSSFDNVLDHAVAMGILIGSQEKWRKVITRSEKISLISAFKNRHRNDDFDSLIWKIRLEKENQVL